MSIVDQVLQHIHDTGKLPDDAKVYIKGVEFTGTDDELLNALGYVDAHMDVEIRMPPSAEPIEVIISVPDCPTCNNVGWLCAGTKTPADFEHGTCCNPSASEEFSLGPGCPSADGCPDCNRALSGTGTGG